MRQRILNIFLLLFFSGQLISQTAKSKKVTIEIGCGYAGVVSDEVYNIRKLATSLDTLELLRLAFLDNTKWRLLALIALENLRIQMPTDNKSNYDNVKEFKKSKSLVYICTDCEGHEPTKIKTLFRKKRTRLRQALDIELNRELKSYR